VYRIQEKRGQEAGKIGEKITQQSVIFYNQKCAEIGGNKN